MNPEPTTPAPEGGASCANCHGAHETQRCPGLQWTPSQSLLQGATEERKFDPILEAVGNEQVRCYEQGDARSCYKYLIFAPGHADKFCKAVNEEVDKCLAASQRENEKLREERDATLKAGMDAHEIALAQCDRLRSSLATKDAQIAELREGLRISKLEHEMTDRARLGWNRVWLEEVEKNNALRAELSSLKTERDDAKLLFNDAVQAERAVLEENKALNTECEGLKKEVDQARATRRAFVKLAKDHHAKITANNKALTARAEAAEMERDALVAMNENNRATWEKFKAERDAALALVENLRRLITEHFYARDHLDYTKAFYLEDKNEENTEAMNRASLRLADAYDALSTALAALPVAGTEKTWTPQQTWIGGEGGDV